MFQKLFVAIFLALFALISLESGVKAANICGDQLVIDEFTWYYDPGGGRPCSNYCYHLNTNPNNVEDCSPTNGDCKTDANVCADVSTCSFTSAQPIYRACSTTNYAFCDEPLERADCAAGYLFSCQDGWTTPSCGCNEERYDCWINWEPTPEPTGAGSTPTPTPTPSCTISFNPDPINIDVGQVAPVSVTVNTIPPAAPIDRVDFAIGNPGIATINPNTDNLSPYQTQITGVSPGATELRATVFMGGVAACGYGTAVDPAPDPVNVTNASSWWQVVNGDVIVNSDIISPIPASCTLPVCDPAFVVTPTGAIGSGIPSYAVGSFFVVSSGIPPGTVSSAGWLAEANYSAQTDYNYAFFERLVPGDTLRNTISGGTVGVGLLVSSAPQTSPDGFKWVFKSGDLRLNRQDNIGSNKIVLFVDGNLTIDGPVRLTPGTGFFMAIASQNIVVDPSVDMAGVDLEGIFVTNGNFTTSSVAPASDTAIEIRGMVAAYGRVDPNRDLPDNSQTPAESFEYAPDLLFNMPPSLQLKRTRWKEVAP